MQTIIVLSVMPGNMRPHVLGNDYYEHFAAYFITGGLLAIGYLRPMQLLSSGVTRYFRDWTALAPLLQAMLAPKPNDPSLTHNSSERSAG